MQKKVVCRTTFDDPFRTIGAPLRIEVANHFPRLSCPPASALISPIIIVILLPRATLSLHTRLPQPQRLGQPSCETATPTPRPRADATVRRVPAAPAIRRTAAARHAQPAVSWGWWRRRLLRAHRGSLSWGSGRSGFSLGDGWACGPVSGGWGCRDGARRCGTRDGGRGHFSEVGGRRPPFFGGGRLLGEPPA